MYGYIVFMFVQQPFCIITVHGFVRKKLWLLSNKILRDARETFQQPSVLYAFYDSFACQSKDKLIYVRTTAIRGIKSLVINQILIVGNCIRALCRVHTHPHANIYNRTKMFVVIKSFL